MNSLVKTLATPISPVMVSITNNAPAQTSPSGAVDAFASRFMPQEPVQQARPVQTRTTPQKPKRVTVEVIDAEIVDEPRRNSR